MIREHDKEIDSLLRRLAKSQPSAEFPAESHIDADEISVFAENALPENAKARVMSHLADCGRCRTILSNVVALNAQEAPHASDEFQAGAAVGLTIPWYKKLFAVRNLATALSAILVLMAGFFAVYLIRNLGDSSDSVARIENANMAPAAEADMAAEAPGEPGVEEESEPNDQPSANIGAMPAATPGAPGRADVEAAPNETAKRKQIPIDVVGRPNDDRVNEKKGGTASGAGKANQNALKATPRISSATQPAMAPAPPPPVAAQKAVPQSVEMAEAERARDKDDAALTDLAAGTSVAKEERFMKRRVGDKNFTQKDKVWYDSDYAGQPTTNVRRGTSAFRDLDSGLRSIANSLSGTVVVVWKNKAYRID